MMMTTQEIRQWAQSLQKPAWTETGNFLVTTLAGSGHTEEFLPLDSDSKGMARAASVVELFVVPRTANVLLIGYCSGSIEDNGLSKFVFDLTSEDPQISLRDSNELLRSALSDMAEASASDTADVVEDWNDHEWWYGYTKKEDCQRQVRAVIESNPALTTPAVGDPYLCDDMALVPVELSELLVEIPIVRCAIPRRRRNERKTVLHYFAVAAGSPAIPPARQPDELLIRPRLGRRVGGNRFDGRKSPIRKVTNRKTLQNVHIHDSRLYLLKGVGLPSTDIAVVPVQEKEEVEILVTA